MVKFFDKKLFFKRLILEFANEKDIENLDRKKCDVILSFNMFLSKPNIQYGIVPTWMLFYKDIMNEDDLFRRQDKNIRNSVNYCVKNNFKYVMLTPGTITHNDLKSFKKMCDEMYKRRGISTRVNLRFVEEYNKNRNIALSLVQKDGIVCSYHLTVLDGCHARSWYSCSLIRGNQTNDSELAKAKRYNRYRDTVYFYKQGYVSYDYGGVNSFINPDGRAKYKMQFCGEEYAVYQKLFNVSKKSKLYNRFNIIFLRITKR